MMRGSCAAAAALLFAVSAAEGSSTQAHAASRTAVNRTVLADFRLQARASDPAATYWVAYGPIAGRFGIVQLKSQGSHVYEAKRWFPRGAHGAFVYLQGHGMVRTKAGLEPGDPVVTVRSLDSVTVGPNAFPLVLAKTASK